MEDVLFIGINFLISAAGVSRSASFIIGYIMTEKRWTLTQAYKYVKSKRDIVYPNWGFQKQLKKIEIKLGFINKKQYEKEVKEKTSFLDNI